MALPSFYIDNINVNFSETVIVRGNTVSNCYGKKITGIQVKNCTNLRAKNNKVLNLKTLDGTGFNFQTINNALLLYNVTSRCTTGFKLGSITALNVYNLTSHNCTTHIHSGSSGLFKNIALSSYIDHKTYKACIGFLLSSGVTIDLDYALYCGLDNLNSGGTLTQGSSVQEKKLLYVDEQNDDLTPDNISDAVNSGTANPIRTDSPDIGGIESEITDELTADRKYQYELLDNSFWDVDNQDSIEMAFIKAYQSRILANAESAEQSVERDMYAKTADSTLRFSELYPMSMRYANAQKFKLRVMDMWYAGQNAGTITAYNGSIGGYNLFPSFFKRMEDIDDAWIIGVSHVDYDNYLLGMEAQKYGIAIDVLGLSTLTRETSGECYNNVMKSVADIAPVYWTIHDEPQPSGYLLFTDLWNSFENCELENMFYDDNFSISPDIVLQDCVVTTPLIPTITWAASGQVELSVLDRIYSEIITRTVYCRQGIGVGNMSDWVSVEHPVGDIINIAAPYIQFKIEIEDIIRRIDYSFIGLCLRNYTTNRIWTRVPT